MDSRVSNRSASSSSGVWDCSICTFTNTREAFKCGMCEARKGTSTRKVKQSDDVVAQQQAAAALVAAQRNQELAHEYGGVIENQELRSQAAKRKKKRKLKPHSDQMYPLSGDMSPDLIPVPPVLPESAAMSTWTPPAPALAASESQHRSAVHARPRHIPPALLRTAKTPRFLSVDRSSGIDTSISVRGLTVIVTEYQHRPLLAVAPMRIAQAAAAAVTAASAPPLPPQPQFRAVGLADARAYAAHKSGGSQDGAANDVSAPPNTAMERSDPDASSTLESTDSLPQSPGVVSMVPSDSAAASVAISSS